MPRSGTAAPVAGVTTWHIEANPAGVGAEHKSPVRIVANGGRGSVLSPAGVVAVLAGLTSYYTAVNVTALRRLQPGAGEFHVTQDTIIVDVLGADVASVTASITAALSTPANTLANP